jgi:hypothetical protein
MVLSLENKTNYPGESLVYIAFQVWKCSGKKIQPWMVQHKNKKKE